MTSPEFLRLYALRSPNMMWLLGAGASAASGIPTAVDMIWDFKRTLFCAEQKVSIRTCQALGDPFLRSRLQRYFDQAGGFPAEGSDREYAEFFTAAYPDEADRRRYIERVVSQATPSYGHLVLAVLMALDRVRLVWSTNFDKNIEDSAARVFRSTGKLTVATLDSAVLAEESLEEERWPVLAKLHGDFQSRRLKNTTDELIAQDQRLRTTLIQSTQRFGLIVAGYSGRDQSIMDALEGGLDASRMFPHGIFWITPPGSTMYPRVQTFLSRAAEKGVEVHQVDANNFDELMSDLLVMIEDIPIELLRHLEPVAPRITDGPLPSGEGGWPVVRLNALPMLSFPSICRRVVCNIGGIKEVRASVKESFAEIIAVRRNVGVLAFGRDIEVRKAFAKHNISEWDLHAIDADRLTFDSMELSLIYDGLVRAISRERGLVGHRRHNVNVLAIDSQNLENPNYAPLLASLETLTGIIPKAGISWTEAIAIRLDLRRDRLWLLMEPTSWVDNLPGKRIPDEVKEFHRRKSASRYNKSWNALVEAWSIVLTGGKPSMRISAFGIADGVDATFEIGRVTAFSRRSESK